VLLGAAAVPTYGTRAEITRGELLWSQDEAFLVIGTNQQGWRRSAGGVVLDVLGGLLYMSAPPQDSKASVVLIHLTADAFHRHVTKNMTMARFSIGEGRLYGDGRMWTGSQFVPASPEERERFASAPSEYNDVEGWSKRIILPQSTPADGVRYVLPVGGGATQLIVRGRARSFGRIEMVRDGRTEEIWSLDGTEDWIAGAAYDAVFLER
jgi:hypothetical protein